MSRYGYRSYMICTAPRSGSTLLCGLLSATGHAGHPDSHFHTPDVSRWLDSYGIDRADFASEAEALKAVIKAARTRGTGDTGLFGLRMQRGSFAYFMQQLGIVHPGLPSDRARIEATFGRTLFIHLSRADKLAQAISHDIATQSGLWHRAADGSELERLSPPKQPVYDRESIAQTMAELSAMDHAWHDWFRAGGITPLPLLYEDLAQDPRHELGKVLDALGLDPALAQGVAPTVSKLPTATNRAWAARFRRESGI